MTKPKVYVHWTCHCGSSVRTELPVTGVWCTRTLACRKAGAMGRPMIEAQPVKGSM